MWSAAADAAGKLRIEVCDTGIGIPQNRQKQVFREFQRLDQGALIARGLGLGLIDRGADRPGAGHRVALYSIPGKGSIFTIEAPLAPASAAPEPLVAGPAPTIGLAGLRVLCIDNEPAILEGMRLLLEGWGCDVITAEDDRSAIAALKRLGGPPDAVVADFHLDKGNGIGAIRAVRRAMKHPVRAIILSADRSGELREKAAGIEAQVFAKPVKPAALRAWLSQVGAQRQAAE